MASPTSVISLAFNQQSLIPDIANAGPSLSEQAQGAKQILESAFGQQPAQSSDNLLEQKL